MGATRQAVESRTTPRRPAAVAVAVAVGQAALRVPLAGPASTRRGCLDGAENSTRGRAGSSWSTEVEIVIRPRSRGRGPATTELEVIRELARCVREIREGLVPE